MRLTIRQSEGMSDWFIIERAEHDGREWIEERQSYLGMTCSAFMHSARFSDADVEGNRDEMLALARGIEARSDTHFKRCAVRFEGDRVFFSSPRNSRREGEVALTEADDLARQIHDLFTGGAS